MKTLLLMFLVFALSGCAMFTSPKEQPVIEDHTHDWFGKNKITVLSTTAERRDVIVKFPQHLFCAEPPPDVAESLASSFSLLAEGAAKSTDATLQLETAKSLSTAIRTLFTRSQGVQVMRDGTFHLCQSFLNKMITEKEYLDLYKELLNVSAGLISKEIPYMADKRAADASENVAEAKKAEVEMAAKKTEVEAATKKSSPKP